MESITTKINTANEELIIGQKEDLKENRQRIRVCYNDQFLRILYQHFQLLITIIIKNRYFST